MKRNVLTQQYTQWTLWLFFLQRNYFNHTSKEKCPEMMMSYKMHIFDTHTQTCTHREVQILADLRKQ